MVTPPPRQAPTASELLTDSTVMRALEEAWDDSQVDDRRHRHEEGGWIYVQVATGEMMTRRAPVGRQIAIDLTRPPVLVGWVVVGKFHTHPNPSSEGWNPGPSDSDRARDECHGVPDLIRADDGIHLSGPECRRGGLAGERGYPT